MIRLRLGGRTHTTVCLLCVAMLLGACTGDGPVKHDPGTAEADKPEWAKAAESEIEPEILRIVHAAVKPTETIIHAVATRFIPTDQTIYRLALYDGTTHETRKLAVDEAGKLVDFGEMIEREKTNDVDRFGLVTPELARTLASLPVARTHRVQVRFDDGELPIRPDGADAADYAEYKETIADNVERARKPVLEFLEKTDAIVHSQATYSPVIELSGSARFIGEELSEFLLLERISDSTFDKPIEHGAEHSTAQLGLGQTFYLRPTPVLGNGIRVGITGEGRGEGVDGKYNCAIDEGNPNLQLTSIVNRATARTCTVDADCNPQCTSKNNASFCDRGACTIYHGTAVAGAIGHAVQRAGGSFSPRVAPAVEIFNANDSSSHADQLDWLINNDVVVENESWGGTATDIHAQDRASLIGLQIVEIAGNGGATNYASCHANNTLCVGGYAVNGSTFSIFNLTSSAPFTGCSRWTIGCDRELPHVALRGESVETTFNNQNDPDRLVNASGTSVAAPIGVGLIALMVQRWPDLFLYWPEPTRAALMASATVDVHTPIPNKTYSDYRPPDERDGAGIPNAIRIENMIDNDQVSRHVFRRGLFSEASARKVIIGRATAVQPGDVIRAVLSWSGCPNSHPDGLIGNGAHADLDLHILDPKGNVVFNAASYDGTVEIGEIVATSAGNYSFEVEQFGWSDCSELGETVYAGFAFDVR